MCSLVCLWRSAPEPIDEPIASVEDVERLEQVVDTSLPLVQQAYSIESEKVCDKHGGNWKKVGRQQAHACVLPANDADNACNDSSECEVACVTENNNMEAGEKARGVCLESTDLFGCRAYVLTALWSIPCVLTKKLFSKRTLNEALCNASQQRRLINVGELDFVRDCN